MFAHPSVAADEQRAHSAYPKLITFARAKNNREESASAGRAEQRNPAGHVGVIMAEVALHQAPRTATAGTIRLSGHLQRERHRAKEDRTTQQAMVKLLMAVKARVLVLISSLIAA